jgi:hypothetical protein
VVVLSERGALEEVVDLPLRGAPGLSYGPPWAHYLGGYQDRLLGGPLGLPGLRCTAPGGVKHKDYGGDILVGKLYMSRTVWKTPRRTRLVLSPYSDL